MTGLKKNMKLIGTADLISDELMAAEGTDALGVVTASNYSADHDSKLNRDFVRIYRQVIPNSTPQDAPTFIAVQAFDGLTAFDKAIAAQKGPIDAQKTIDGIRGLSFESPRGPLVIDSKTREVHENMYIRRTTLINGKFANPEIAAIPIST